MQTLLIESAIRATLIAAVIAVVLWAMRIKTASVLHAVWASVVILMMLLPAWIAWGPKASLAVLPSQTTATIVPPDGMPPPLPAGLTQYVASPVREDGGYRLGEYAIPGIYLLGLCALLLRLAIGTIRANRMTSASCVVPVTVGWLHPRIILPESSREWPRAQLDAVLAHEGEHIRRRDPLFQWLALLNRAIFWFHPLAWWLERKVSGLAEEACDAAVLLRGCDPGEYSEYLLDLARSVQRAGTRVNAVGMAMPGIGLKHRIRQMLSGVPVPRISRPRMAFTVAMCASAAAILAAGTLDHVHRTPPLEPRFPLRPTAVYLPSSEHVRNNPEILLAQNARPLVVPAPAFEVTSVKPYQSGQIPSLELTCAKGRFVARGSRLGPTLWWAYDIKPNQVVGSPDWVESAYSKSFYDIEAKTSGPVTEAQCKLMVQSLLADRFKLVTHRELREVSVYALVVAKNGPKMRKVTEDDTSPGINVKVDGRPMGVPRGGATRPPGWSMDYLADFLAIAQLGRPIVNRTGLEGAYKISLDFSTSFPRQPDYIPPFDAGPDIRDALREQLGLRLDNAKALVPQLFIDHIEKPDAN